ncbi:MAG: phosphatase PAP2 family protein [Clostridia bacterium]|nr:phosphatase PAP2 family protein [Clostridia bacterium]
MYEKTVCAIYKRRGVMKALCVLDKFFCALIYALFAYICLKSFLADVLLGVKVILSCFIPFVAVSIIRAKINSPRPKQVCRFDGFTPSCRDGKSFPSRHAFSAFCISTVSVFIALPFGIAGMIVAALICAIRVLLGYHFVRDVVAGGIIGIISGVLGALLF